MSQNYDGEIRNNDEAAKTWRSHAEYYASRARPSAMYERCRDE
jgi:hypothetical protein